MPYTLSVMICTLESRFNLLANVVAKLNNQIHKLNAFDMVHVDILSDNGQMTTGEKRNILLQRATGEYVVFIDDDDDISDFYLQEILNAAKLNCDSIAIDGFMTTNGKDKTSWRISKDNPYKAIVENGKTVYLRFNNHISPIRRTIAQRFSFPEKKFGEDYEWALSVHLSRLIQTEAKTNGELYHYVYKTKK